MPPVVGHRLRVAKRKVAKRHTSRIKAKNTNDLGTAAATRKMTITTITTTIAIRNTRVDHVAPRGAAIRNGVEDPTREIPGTTIEIASIRTNRAIGLDRDLAIGTNHPEGDLEVVLGLRLGDDIRKKMVSWFGICGLSGLGFIQVKYLLHCIIRR